MRQFKTCVATLLTGVAAIIAGTAVMTAGNHEEARKNPRPGGSEQATFTTRVSNETVRKEFKIPACAVPATNRISDDIPFYGFTYTTSDREQAPAYSADE